jgi:hypothetical protein
MLGRMELGRLNDRSVGLGHCSWSQESVGGNLGSHAVAGHGRVVVNWLL